MNNQSKESNLLEQDLSSTIFEMAKGEIPETACKRLAQTAIKRMKYDTLRGERKAIDEYADDCIWAYFQ